MSLRSRSGRPAEDADGRSGASVAVVASSAACTASCAPAHSSSRGGAARRNGGAGWLVVALLWLLHVGYSCVLVWQCVRDVVHRWWRLGPRIAMRRIRAAASSAPPQPTPLHADAFARLPAHLAFSLAPSQLQYVEVQPPGGAASPPLPLCNSSSSVAAFAPAVSVASSLISSCMQLPLPELTLYDDDDVLSRCWPAVGVRLAALQQASASNPSLILVLQGAAVGGGDQDADTAAANGGAPAAGAGSERAAGSSRATGFPPPSQWSASAGSDSAPLVGAGHLVVVHRGRWCVVGGAPFLRDVDAEEDEAAHVFVDTSRPGVALPRPPPRPAHHAATEEEGPAALWRARMARWVAAHRAPYANGVGDGGAGLEGAYPVAADVRLVSFLGAQHSRRALAQAAVRLAVTATPPRAAASVPAHPSCPSPPDLRLHLQRSVLPLSLSEPQLLLCVSGSSRSLLTPLQRSVQGFPPWLLRLCEMGFVGTVSSVTHGYELQLALMHFASSVQRGGT